MMGLEPLTGERRDELVGEPGILGARRRALETLSTEHWDLVVIGGGITGSGILLDAVSRGLRAALIEREDFAVGTSSRSSRLIHGGLRYLEQLHLGLVREALRERAVLLRLAPHLVRMEPFLVPLFGSIATRPYMQAGLTLYDQLGAASDGGRHRHLSVSEALEAVPSLRREGLRGGLVYHDGLEDDARYALSVVRTARGLGALAVTRATVEDGIEESGRLVGLRVRDELGGAQLDVRADHVVDAMGAWSGLSTGPFPVIRGHGAVRPSRGTHILVSRERIPSRFGLTLRIPGRVCFLVPWPGCWVIGTTDLDDDGSPDRPAPTMAEVDSIIANVNANLDVGLGRGDVVGAYAGLRPLARDPGRDGTSTAKVSREHRIRAETNGLVRIGGGKYTTYRLMASQVVDSVLGPQAARRRPSVTADLPLVGADSLERLAHLSRRLQAQHGLGSAQADQLVARHGTEAAEVALLGGQLDLLHPLGPGINHLEVEVVRAVRDESALSLDDVLSRRMRLAQELPDRGASIAPHVADLMAGELGWSVSDRATMIHDYLATAHREFDAPAISTGPPEVPAQR